jgi:hypothetical protein
MRRASPRRPARIPLLGCLLALLLGTAHPRAGHADVTAGLVARYPLDGDAQDIAGTRNGTISGNVAPAADRHGNPSGAMSFDGVSAFIKADASGLPTAERTVMFWVYFNTEGHKDAPFGYGGGSCGTSWLMGVNAVDWSFPTNMFVSGHCNANSLVYNYGNPIAHRWHHWAVTTSPEGTRMYLDGHLVDSNEGYTNNTNVTGTDLSLGVLPSPGGIAPYTDTNVGYLDGRLDDVRIYDRALSLPELIEAGGPDLPLPAASDFGLAALAFALALAACGALVGLRSRATA